MNRFKRAIEISRPIFWPSTFFTFLIGVIFSGSKINLQSLVFACLWAFPYSLWICSVNDYFDFDTDKINQFKGKISGAKPTITEKPFLIFLAVTSFLTLIIPTIILTNTPSLFWSLAAIFIVFIYSSPPIRLKTKPLLDSLSNGAFVASVFLAGYFNHSGNVVLSRQVVLAAFGFVLGVSAIHILGALRDYTPDKATGMKTIAVSLGQKLSAAVATILFLILFIISFNFPIEFRAFSFYGLTCCGVLWYKPNEKRTVTLGLTLLIGFFLAATISIAFGSWRSFL